MLQSARRDHWLFLQIPHLDPERIDVAIVSRSAEGAVGQGGQDRFPGGATHGCCSGLPGGQAAGNGIGVLASGYALCGRNSSALLHPLPVDTLQDLERSDRVTRCLPT